MNNLPFFLPLCLMPSLPLKEKTCYFPSNLCICSIFILNIFIYIIYRYKINFSVLFYAKLTYYSHVCTSFLHWKIHQYTAYPLLTDNHRYKLLVSPRLCLYISRCEYMPYFPTLLHKRWNSAWHILSPM